MFLLEMKDGKCIAITNATDFKVDKKLKLVLFKRGFQNIAMYELSKIESVNKFETENQFHAYQHAKQKDFI